MVESSNENISSFDNFLNNDYIIKKKKWVEIDNNTRDKLSRQIDEYKSTFLKLIPILIENDYFKENYDKPNVLSNDLKQIYEIYEKLLELYKSKSQYNKDNTNGQMDFINSTVNESQDNEKSNSEDNNKDIKDNTNGQTNFTSSIVDESQDNEKSNSENNNKDIKDNTNGQTNFISLTVDESQDNEKSNSEDNNEDIKDNTNEETDRISSTVNKSHKFQKIDTNYNLINGMINFDVVEKAKYNYHFLDIVMDIEKFLNRYRGFEKTLDIEKYVKYINKDLKNDFFENNTKLIKNIDYKIILKDYNCDLYSRHISLTIIKLLKIYLEHFDRDKIINIFNIFFNI